MILTARTVTFTISTDGRIVHQVDETDKDEIPPTHVCKNIKMFNTVEPVMHDASIMRNN